MSTRARTHHRTGRLAALVPLTVAALVAGCAPDPTPAPTRTALSPSATPTSLLPAPAPSPRQPTEMSRDDETGAAAAVAYVLSLYAYTESAQDTAPWSAISHPSCKFCQGVLDDVAARRAAGQTARFQPLIVTSRRTLSASALQYSIAVSVAAGPDSSWTKDGRLIDPGRVTTAELTFLVVFQIDRWLVREAHVKATS